MYTNFSKIVSAITSPRDRKAIPVLGLVSLQGDGFAVMRSQGSKAFNFTDAVAVRAAGVQYHGGQPVHVDPRALPPSGPLALDGDTLSHDCGTVPVVRGEAPHAFKPIPTEPGTYSAVRLGARALVGLLAAADTERSSVVLSGVGIQEVGSSVWATATNGKLLLSEQVAQLTPMPHGNVILRPEMITALKATGYRGPVDVYWTKRDTWIVCDEWQIHSMPLDGTYPPWSSVLEYPRGCTLAPAGLLATAAKRVLEGAPKHNAGVVYGSDGAGRLQQIAGDRNCRFEDDAFEGPGHLVCFNGRYMQQVSRWIGPETVLHWGGKHRATTGRTSERFALIMPVTLPESLGRNAPVHATLGVPESAPFVTVGKAKRKAKPEPKCKSCADALSALRSGNHLLAARILEANA